MLPIVREVKVKKQKSENRDFTIIKWRLCLLLWRFLFSLGANGYCGKVDSLCTCVGKQQSFIYSRKKK